MYSEEDVMKKLLLVGCAVLGLVVAAVPVQARGLLRCRDRCEPVCCMKVIYEEREVTVMKPVWKEKEEKVKVCKLVPREEVRKHECTVMVPEWKDEKRTVTVITCKPREVERAVCRTTWVRECCVDPCTGCTRTVCKPHTVVEKVKCIVMDCVPEKKEVTVKVCHYKPEKRTWETKCTVYDRKEETVTRKVMYCEMQPHKQKVKVAVCVPVVCAPACPPLPCK
jgi:hypothetical protein